MSLVKLSFDPLASQERGHLALDLVSLLRFWEPP